MPQSEPVELEALAVLCILEALRERKARVPMIGWLHPRKQSATNMLRILPGVGEKCTWTKPFCGNTRTPRENGRGSIFFRLRRSAPIHGRDESPGTTFTKHRCNGTSTMRRKKPAYRKGRRATPCDTRLRPICWRAESISGPFRTYSGIPMSRLP